MRLHSAGHFGAEYVAGARFDVVREIVGRVPGRVRLLNDLDRLVHFLDRAAGVLLAEVEVQRARRDERRDIGRVANFAPPRECNSGSSGSGRCAPSPRMSAGSSWPPSPSAAVPTAPPATCASTPSNVRSSRGACYPLPAGWRCSRPRGACRRCSSTPGFARRPPASRTNSVRGCVHRVCRVCSARRIPPRPGR